MDSQQLTQKLQETTDWLKKEFAAIRSGQASPGLLDGVTVESYGAFMQMNQVATIGVEDARTLRVSPYDASQVSVIEQAIQEADLGVSLASDSSGLRVIFPELTSERRVQLQKLAKSRLEDARIAVRSARDEAMKTIDKLEKEGEISEDDKFGKKEDAQKQIEAANTSLEALYAQKEIELAA